MSKNPIKDYLSTIGKKGGSAGTGKAKARSSEQARAAARTRWANRDPKPDKPQK